MEKIFTENAPAPAGHYSQAVVHNGLVYVAGQLPIDPASGEKKLGTIGEQTEQVLKNMQAILEASGSGLDKVLKTTVYISDIENWGDVNNVYTRYFGDHKPARVVVPTRELHFGFMIEMECVAVV
ncbi:Rid family detoxifying hydrolase [candidate division KSB1 bacterium]